jgi:hypothetical protein
MDMETIWLMATQLRATAEYVMKIDKGERSPGPRKEMVERIKELVERLQRETKE